MATDHQHLHTLVFFFPLNEGTERIGLRDQFVFSHLAHILGATGRPWVGEGDWGGGGLAQDTSLEQGLLPPRSLRNRP